MLTREENERLTRVGPGTPGGGMLRRYWWPVAFSEHVTSAPTKIKVLDEELVLYWGEDGRVSMMELRCAHRGVALNYGRVEGECIRCPYHGWLYDRSGQCVEQPAEPDESTFKDRIRLRAYAVQELAGFVFAYMGPEPAPLLPRYDLLCSEDGVRTLWGFVDHCNWAQSAENAIDQAHLMWLHASHYPSMAGKPAKIEWARTDYGLRAVTHVRGIPVPKVSCVIFPSINRFTNARVDNSGSLHSVEGPRHNLLYRVPIDDSHTLNMFLSLTRTADGKLVQKTGGFRPTEPGVYKLEDDGWWTVSSQDQDRMVQEQQGAVADRSREHLGASDRGIIMLREMIRESIEAVAEGRDPHAVIRDPAANYVIEIDASMAELAALPALA